MNGTEERVVIALLRAGDKWLTRSMVGRAVGLKRTPYLNNMLDRLVENGVIERELGNHGGFSCWFYHATPETVQTFVVIPIDEWVAGVQDEQEQ